MIADLVQFVLALAVLLAGGLALERGWLGTALFCALLLLALIAFQYTLPRDRP